MYHNWYHICVHIFVIVVGTYSVNKTFFKSQLCYHMYHRLQSLYGYNDDHVYNCHMRCCCFGQPCTIVIWVFYNQPLPPPPSFCFWLVLKINKHLTHTMQAQTQKKTHANCRPIHSPRYNGPPYLKSNLIQTCNMIIFNWSYLPLRTGLSVGFLSPRSNQTYKILVRTLTC